MNGLGKILKRTALAGGMALALANCDLQDKDNYEKYAYAGKIGDEYVKMYESGVSDILRVTRKDGVIIKYVDSVANKSPNQSSDVNYFVVIKHGAKKYYYNSPTNGEAIKEAQKQFNDYLSKILEKKEQDFKSKHQESLDAIRK